MTKISLSTKPNTPACNDEPIAIVGIGCRYPGGANNPKDFWQFLLDGKDGFCDTPSSRWDIERFCDPDGQIEGTAKPRQAAFLSDQELKGFDAHFFGLSPREAECIDPQQRLLLQVAWEAFEDANIRPSDWAQRPIGVYAGGFTVDNYILQLSSENFLKVDQATNSSSSLVMLSNRLSYFFNFKGPSLTIDTACSSSLVALNYACQDIWNGNTEAALVGGVNAMLHPGLTVTMSKGGFLSPESRSKTFDAQANGYARGEGAGLIILKPLSHAIADGDRIYSQILATGVNQDGKSAGIASPNKSSQRDLIKSVISKRGINTNDIALIEAHGTGTAVGDPTEVSALSEALGVREDGQERHISSVKGNIGHQEAGAGIAGIIKATLSLYHDQVPPQVGFNELNPSVDIKTSRLNIPQQIESLCSQDAAKLACINSFGYGGTNAHVILEAATPERPPQTGQSAQEETMLLLSAKSQDALKEEVSQIRDLVCNNTELNIADLAHTLACGRDAFDFRLNLHANDVDSARDVLEQTYQQLEQGSLILEPTAVTTNKKLVFVYTGMGPQWWGMGQALYQNSSVFKQAVTEADEAFRAFAGWSILDEMLKDETSSRMASNEISQPANFIIQHGLTVFLQHWGIRPTAIIGHSVGEVCAALAAGAITLSQAAEVAFHRSRLQQKKAGQGRMLATALDLEMATSIVELYEGKISIGAINSPSSIALAGDEDVLRAIMEELDGQGIFNKLIFGEVAYHSHQMDELEKELRACLSNLEPSSPSIPLYSTTYGREIVTPEHNADYWWANVRQPVLFDEALKKIINVGFETFIEMGPHPVLSGAIAQVFASYDGDKKATSLSSLTRGKPELQQLLSLSGNLWTKGQLSDFSCIIKGSKTNIPNYPWQQEMRWRESQSANSFLMEKRISPLLGRRTTDLPATWENVLDSSTLACLKDHIVDGKTIFPGAGYIEIFLAAIRDLHPLRGFGLSDVRFENLLYLPEKGSLHIRTVSNEKDLLILARDIESDEDWHIYARANIVHQNRTAPAKKNINPTLDTGLRLDATGTYDKLDQMGLNYAKNFRPIQFAHISGQRVTGQLKLETDNWHDPRLITHPSLLDGGLQLLALCNIDSESPPVPVQVGKISNFESFPTHGSCIHVEGEIRADNSAILSFHNEDGSLLLELDRVEMQNIPRKTNTIIEDSYLYHFNWADYAPDTNTSQSLTVKTIHGEPSKEAEIRSHWPQITRPDDLPVHLFFANSDLAPDTLELIDFINFINDSEKNTPHERLVLVTVGAWRIQPQDIPSPAQAALWGAYRTTRQEKPTLKIASIDLEPGFQNWAGLAGMIASLPDQGEYGVRQDKIYRHTLKNSSAKEIPSNVAVPNQNHFLAKLTVRERGGFAGLHYQAEHRRAPNADEIEVEIAYSAINFKDVLKVLSRLTEQSLKGTFFQKSIGMEASATVIRAGQNTDFIPGERIIFGNRSGTLQSHITFNPADSFLLRWDDLPLNLEELATLPISYVSAFYALKKVAHLTKGETVLLHSASGGLGHAAIWVAREIGATIIVTAGTKEKRDYLRNLGIEHVFNSRNLDYEKDVLKVTQGQGVDVILNFLPDALLHANLRILKPFGRMIELGKADIGANKGLPLGEFERNLTLTSVDIDHMLSVRRDIFNAAMQEMKSYFPSGAYQALPTIVAPAHEAIFAFKKMAEGNHIGKCLLDYTQEIPHVNFPQPNAMLIKPQACYVVTGGTSGFGLECAKWLHTQGATHIVLLSRSGQMNEEIEELANLLTKKEGSLSSLSCDVGDLQQTNDVFKKISSELPPIVGIFHAAAVLKDGPLNMLSDDMIKESFHAKAIGAYNLHKISIELDLALEHLVFFSSISGMIGNLGQANYSAANVYLDALAEYRRHLGLSGTSIAWGAIAEVGMVARDVQVTQMLERRGITPLRLKDAFENLQTILTLGQCNMGCFNVDWEKWQKSSPSLSEFDPISDLILVSEDALSSSLISQLSSANEDEYESITCRFLVTVLAEVLHISEDLVPLEKPISELGIDSLMSIEFQLSLDASIGQSGLSIQPDIQASLRDLAKALLTTLQNQDNLSPENSEEDFEIVSSPLSDRAVDDIDVSALSDIEVSQMLEELSAQENNIT